MRLTLEKKERLNNRSLIRHLYTGGNIFHLSPFRVIWLPLREKTGDCFQLLISVPKSNIRLATGRNQIRRRIREAYRLNKGILREAVAKGAPAAAFCITYTSREILPFSTIQEKIILILQRLLKENEKVTR